MPDRMMDTLGSIEPMDFWRVVKVFTGSTIIPSNESQSKAVLKEVDPNPCGALPVYGPFLDPGAALKRHTTKGLFLKTTLPRKESKGHLATISGCYLTIHRPPILVSGVQTTNRRIGVDTTTITYLRIVII